MNIVSIKCKGCGDIVFSRVRHDYRRCSCEKVAVDGGQDYLKITNPFGCITGFIELDTTKKQLFDDWKTKSDIFGIIKKKDKKYNMFIPISTNKT